MDNTDHHFHSLSCYDFHVMGAAQGMMSVEAARPRWIGAVSIAEDEFTDDRERGAHALDWPIIHHDNAIVVPESALSGAPERSGGAASSADATASLWRDLTMPPHPQDAVGGRGWTVRWGGPDHRQQRV